MLRTRTLTYLLALSLGTGAAFTTISAVDGRTAEAKKAKKAKKTSKKSKKAKASGDVDGKLSADQKKARTELIGSFQFGMSKDQVIDAFSKQLDDRYADLISGTEDIAKQDDLRKQKGLELARFKKSYIEFTGKKSGWDVSIVSDQFRQTTDESMLVEWENQGGKNQRRFFFFHNGELYKMFIQIDTDQFQGDAASFDAFASAMGARYGASVWKPEDANGNDNDISVRVIDKSKFYDAYCLVAFDGKKAKEVAEVRKERLKPEQNTDAVNASVVDDGSSKPSLDDNNSAVKDAISASGGDPNKSLVKDKKKGSDSDGDGGGN